MFISDGRGFCQGGAFVLGFLSRVALFGGSCPSVGVVLSCHRMDIWWVQEHKYIADITAHMVLHMGLHWWPRNSDNIAHRLVYLHDVLVSS